MSLHGLTATKMEGRSSCRLTSGQMLLLKHLRNALTERDPSASAPQQLPSLPYIASGARILPIRPPVTKFAACVAGPKPVCLLRRSDWLDQTRVIVLDVADPCSPASKSSPLRGRARERH